MTGSFNTTRWSELEQCSHNTTRQRRRWCGLGDPTVTRRHFGESGAVVHSMVKKE
ncbi:alpha/beta hydrolase [Sesbania bispinosa]|nr:alpha/beta hydrolase [Sesbania bispinosa]